MRLGGIGCNKDCCEANTEHPKAPKQAVAKGRRKRQGSTNGDEAAVLEAKRRPQGHFANKSAKQQEEKRGAS
jgi:hypothetical protein